MNKPPLRVVRNEATKSADIFLYGIVGDYWYSDSPVTARNLQRQLSLLTDFPIIHLHLNGPGGDVHEGLTICNIIKASKKEIHTWNDGICLSMMATILECVQADRKHAAKASLTMIHAASTIAWGNSQEMRDTADMLDKHDDVLAEIFADGTGLTVEQVKSKWFDGKDHWLTAKEGEALGLFSVEDYEIADIPENPMDMPFEQVAAFYNSKSNITQKTDMSILNFNNFKKISALGKVPVAERTPALIAEANAELEAEGITGLTLVSDTDLQETVTAAGKVPVLEKQVTDLGIEKTALTQKVTDLETIVADQKVKLGKPASKGEDPKNLKPDGTLNDQGVKDDYATSVDAEYARLYPD